MAAPSRSRAREPPTLVSSRSQAVSQRSSPYMTRPTTSGPDFLSCNQRSSLAAAIREAAWRAVTLWPEEPGFGSADAYGWKGQTITGGKGDAKAGSDLPGTHGAGTAG
jgi:hypothetical protein